MSRRRPRSNDPHSWIKDTTKKSGEPEASAQAAETEPAEESATAGAAGADEETAAPKGAPRRVVVVEYLKNDGSIVTVHEMYHEASEGAAETPASASEGSAVARVALTDKMVDKTLLDIHENYKVAISKKKPTLVPKR